MNETPGTDGLDYKDAWNVANHRAPTSNLARCYISAIQALIRIKGQAMSGRADIGLITYTCNAVVDEIEKAP